ncbi:hypothetical protein GT028_27050 [Streptomyces sp. SID2999]|uniref:hypothetical protein n=1 Tax=Streptomyces sp. SID2999 TaxID=2690258 RepID=UPI001368E200|nr:hypothetical protein [Streptomyces sp. SID2999]MYZ10989.1 hypothetical protein [Streptomyces sp. SID2999]
MAAGLLLTLGTAHPAVAEEDGLRFDEAIERITTEAGSSYDLSGGITNGTDRTLATVYLRIDLDRSFSFSTEHRNCWYTTADATLAVNRVICRIKGPVRPGRSYDLYLGRVSIDLMAEDGRISYSVTADQREAALPPSARRGGGDTLALTERDRVEGRIRPTPPEPHAPVSTAVEIGTVHDFSVNEVTLRGKPGDLVKGDFFFVNNGPTSAGAVFDDESDNDTAVVAELTLPPALKVVKAPRNCRGSKSKAKGKSAPAVTGYHCWQGRTDKSSLMTPGQFEHFPFTFRIDGTDDTPGRISMPDRSEFKDGDGDLSNNSAAIEVDVVDGPTASTVRAVGALLAAVLALGGGALWLRRRSGGARTTGGDR